MNAARRILVLCTGNSCRSQMAEGWLRHLAGGRAEIYSAGITPAGVNPRAVLVMREAGVDISGHTSNHVDEYRGVEFDYVITVCDNAREHCPYFPSTVQQFHRDFEDPTFAVGTEEEILTRFRDVRDQIREYCREFVEIHLDPASG